jgi:hypothetical protein
MPLLTFVTNLGMGGSPTDAPSGPPSGTLLLLGVGRKWDSSRFEQGTGVAGNRTRLPRHASLRLPSGGWDPEALRG